MQRERERRECRLKYLIDPSKRCCRQRPLQQLALHLCFVCVRTLSQRMLVGNVEDRGKKDKQNRRARARRTNDSEWTVIQLAIDFRQRKRDPNRVCRNAVTQPQPQSSSIAIQNSKSTDWSANERSTKVFTFRIKLWTGENGQPKCYAIKFYSNKTAFNSQNFGRIDSCAFFQYDFTHTQNVEEEREDLKSAPSTPATLSMHKTHIKTIYICVSDWNI